MSPSERRSGRALVLGFYQGPKAAHPVIAELRKKRMFRSAVASVAEDGKSTVETWILARHLTLAAGIGFSLFIAVIYDLIEARMGVRETWLHIGVAALIAAGIAWLGTRLLDLYSARRFLARYSRWLLRGESLVLAEVSQVDASDAAEILQGGEGEHPAVFILRPHLRAKKEDLIARHGAPLTEQALNLKAARLAEDLGKISGRKGSRKPLRPRLDHCEDILRTIIYRLSETARLEQSVALSAEWLLDNAYVVQGHIEDFKRNLPSGFYRELPLIDQGPGAGYPRVYTVATEMVADSDGRLTRDSIQNYLRSFQSNVRLTTGELWALPPMLHLALIEFLTGLSLEVDRRQSEGDLASFWGNRLLHTARRQPEKMPEALADLAAESSTPTPHFVAELLGQLYDEEVALTPVRAWLKSKFPATLEEVIHQEEQAETSEQVSLSNSITTLRLLSQLDWREVFEQVSLVVALLWTDPAQVYQHMDFVTRDRYRHVIEQLSKRSKRAEEEVAQIAIELARAASIDYERHVGYFLVDAGRGELVANLNLKLGFRHRLRGWMAQQAALTYVAALTAVTAGILAGFLIWSHWQLLSNPDRILLLVFAVLPCSELGMQVVNYFITRFLTPRPLAKMQFRDGIPDEFRTLVIVPTMLLTPESIRDELERLEIRALANPDGNLVYGLASDFSDALNEDMPEDIELLEVAVHGIENLNRKHPDHKFVLFHRARQWSESEHCWMGWERKRGKLEDLNGFLLEEPESEDRISLAVGSRKDLGAIRFVITLDSDTQLPRDTARRLVATLAHPLNQPVLAKDGRSLERGYSLIQPRVSTALPSATVSLFTRLFSDPTGLDPYTRAVSDVYQDLSGYGNYHGKGIYDLRSFHAILKGRFPEMRLLSHDLIEGAYARVALASDIELIDLFPADYSAFRARQHRWTRGDWQIAAWVLPKVLESNSRSVRNTLPALEKQKILDNLRRSLVPAGILALLIYGVIFSPLPIVTLLLAACACFAPTFLQFFDRLTHPWKVDPMAWQEPGLNVGRGLLLVAIMPDQAALNLDAIVRALYRRFVSHRLVLEWTTSAMAQRRTRMAGPKYSLLQVAWLPGFAIIASALVLALHPYAIGYLIPFSLLWACAPLLVYWLNEPARAKAPALTHQDRNFLRQVARQTWRFFDEFVNEQSHWLPVDNFQDSLRVEIAQRTSPTNIGLYLVSVLSAHDLGCLTTPQVFERLLPTMQTLAKLERHQGHILNWYETDTLAPLGEKYISTVDSGNLMACLWVLSEGLEDLLAAPLLDSGMLTGLTDVVAILDGLTAKRNPLGRRDLIAAFNRLASNPSQNTENLVSRIRDLRVPARALEESLQSKEEAAPEYAYWAAEIIRSVTTVNELVDRCLAWVETLSELPADGLMSLGPNAHSLRREALAEIPSLKQIANGPTSPLMGLIGYAYQHQGQTPDSVKQWVQKLSDQLLSAQRAAAQILTLADQVLAYIRQLDEEMDMGFLYNREQRLFVVGFNVSQQRLDNSFYDLLASEARIASFISIARGDIPTGHWWALRRPFGRAHLSRPLLSWSGTMFEYLMPLLFTRCFDNSLLDQACRNALECQIDHATRRGIPWGISEAAFSALDSRQIYQYRAFGVPELALKRGVEEDFVVAPYATALALAVDPRASIQNLRRILRIKPEIRGKYGYYESIDYTRQSAPQGERGILVQTFMAHHQGMLLAAIDNALNKDIMQRRFHSDPRVLATESLLYERIPVAPPLVKSYPRETPISRLAPIVSVPVPGRIDTPDTATPRTHLISNGSYHVMVTNAGGGYSRWRDLDITRWRADTTMDSLGDFCYVKDLDTGQFWSITHQPTLAESPYYQALFATEKAEFRIRDRGIEETTEIVVSPEDNAEIRRITIVNRSPRQRRLEVTTYAELALAPHNVDRAHPAFNKMFIETAALHDLEGLLAWRRPRAPGESPVWVAHVLAAGARSNEAAQYETSRSSFIGRGRNLQSPIALERNLSGETGYVLDPIFSLRRRITLAPGQRIQLASVMVAADTKDQAVSLAGKYSYLEASERALDLAWTQAQLELRHLRIQPSEAQLYQQLASHVIYPHAHLRASAERITRNTLGQNRLWAYGISGDLPIVLVTVDVAEHIDLVQEALSAHSFWHSRGLRCDLVILNQEAASYLQPLHVELQRIVNARAQAGADQPGGVFLRPAAQIAPEDMNLLLSVARVVLVAARGPIAQQIGTPLRQWRQPAAKLPVLVQEQPSEPLPTLELDAFNELGGFAHDGREYAINLRRGRNTPAPWCNVLANPRFGALVSEQGMDAVWADNSQSNRLTPWSNDTVCGTPGDVIYIFEAELDALWTPTPLPVRENDAYRVCHGQGYTTFYHNSHAINQELTTFVPLGHSEAPVRVQRLKLKNQTNRRRELSLTFYVDLVLGVDREDSQTQAVTSWDMETHALFARNGYRSTAGGSVAFAACYPRPNTFSGNRTEILGRNGSRAKPEGLLTGALSCRVGAALDPCAALQMQIELQPGEERTFVFILGEVPTVSEARTLIRSLATPEGAATALNETQRAWDDILEVLQVDTPDSNANKLLNRWLVYQTLGCRFWGRTAFYQSGGAFGFRDQLQDSLALVYGLPALTREHILRCASRQFIEGDVQHWWHPDTGAGVRTRISDDLLWLPFATAHYVRVTGDTGILDESVRYIEGAKIEKGEAEAYFIPTASETSETLIEHCRRAIDKGLTVGPHGLPLIGTGDWNDGLNLVGAGGKGESVWLAWFLVHVLHDFAGLLELKGDADGADKYKEKAGHLIESIEANAWDGEWYRRAYFDDGTPLGSKDNPEARIDSLPQSWAVISGGGDQARARQAVTKAHEQLVRDGLVLLFTPPFDSWAVQPGYIKGYPPGVRENGGQYTHGSLWLPMAWARLGEGDNAYHLLRAMSPITHSLNQETAQKYKVEPYVAAADIYALPGKEGMGGWTWYTGSSGWMYRVWIEELLGFKLRGDKLTIDPCIPKNWEGFKMRYRFRTAIYEIEVLNPSPISKGVISVEVDGQPAVNGTISLVDDGGSHAVRITITAKS